VIEKNKTCLVDERIKVKVLYLKNDTMALVADTGNRTAWLDYSLEEMTQIDSTKVYDDLCNVGLGGMDAIAVAYGFIELCARGLAEVTLGKKNESFWQKLIGLFK